MLRCITENLVFASFLPSQSNLSDILDLLRRYRFEQRVLEGGSGGAQPPRLRIPRHFRDTHIYGQESGCEFMGYRLCRRPLVHRPSMSKPFNVSWASPISRELTLMGRRLSGCWLARSCHTHMHATSAHARMQSAGSRIRMYVYVCMCVCNMRACMRSCISICTCTCARAHVHLDVNARAYLYTCRCACACVAMCT